ncbi:uncharacterized protein NFIA_064300 [Aspergillus fischeri NRRL 181]|uniref:Uncharacterized protein n=1 Tax=Neosartorya fischeri (strain ATCC 1020 / DSM 3700 / CBS 544.65 / FGSC A1164 / JCM 1740 / NRRL 181 / WB 181) TaxID=331117 RepID=A1D6C2_NEOFI|nr:conserved hypothetical protein [Aspergillus fischeri NRRL 181]EAW21266.1 conserved hypothetical protein [Aspergillus fischeri NRRL 181]KAG2014875.1 hypothetical protein GB937_006333 [Aspergillus fischeri]
MPIYIPLTPPRLQPEFNHNYNYGYNTMQWRSPGQTPRVAAYDTEDEEEVVYDLDEHAMACLPHHLQQVMRELHMERLERLQRENPYFKFRSPVPYNRNRYASAWLDSVASQLAERRLAHRAGYHQIGETPNVLSQQMGCGESQRRATAEPQHTLGDTVNQAQIASRTPESGLTYHQEEIIADAGVETERNSSPIQEYFAERDDKSRTHIRYATWYGGQPLGERSGSPEFRRRRSPVILEMRSRLQKKIGRMSRFFKRYSVA